MMTTLYNRVLLSKPLMRVLLLFLLATCLTSCSLQFPFYCEDDQASICYLLRRPILAPREKPTSDPTSAPRDGARPDDAPRSPLTKTILFFNSTTTPQLFS